MSNKSHLAIALSSISSLLLVGALGAQNSFFVPDNVSTSGGCNVIPFGHTSTTDANWNNQIYHTLITPTDVSNTTGLICDLGFVPCVTGIRMFKTIEIRMDYFQGTGTTMSTTFTSNISNNAVTVLKAADYAWHVTADQWNRIGLQKPFLYVPSRGSLIIELKVTGAGSQNVSTAFPGFRTGARQRVYAYGSQWVGGQPPQVGRTSTSSAQKIEIVYSSADLGMFGQGCQGSNSKVPSLMLSGSAALGKIVTVSLADALPNAPHYFVLGLTQLSTPFDLGLAGAPGCSLYISTEVVLFGVADASGAWALRLPVPNNSSLVCARVHAQSLPHDKNANAFGATATNYGRILVGN